MKGSKVKLPLSLLLKSVWQHRAGVINLSLYSCLHFVSKIVISALTMFAFPGNADGCSSTKVNLPSPTEMPAVNSCSSSPTSGTAKGHCRDSAMQASLQRGSYARGSLALKMPGTDLPWLRLPAIIYIKIQFFPFSVKMVPWSSLHMGGLHHIIKIRFSQEKITSQVLNLD